MKLLNYISTMILSRSAFNSHVKLICVCVVQLKSYGFAHFVGIDGSEAMLELARESGFYQDLKQCLLGEDHLPVQCGNLMVHTSHGSLVIWHHQCNRHYSTVGQHCTDTDSSHRRKIYSKQEDFFLL